MSKILPRFPQWISPRISLPVANLGEIPGKITLRFLPQWICSSARILVRFMVAFQRDFGHQDYCFLARILARFAAGLHRDFGRQDFFFSVRILARFKAGSRRDFGHRDFCFPARILPRFAAGSQRDFGHREFRFPARFPPGRKIPVAKISSGSRRDSIFLSFDLLALKYFLQNVGNDMTESLIKVAKSCSSWTCKSLEFNSTWSAQIQA